MGRACLPGASPGELGLEQSEPGPALRAEPGALFSPGRALEWLCSVHGYLSCGCDPSPKASVVQCPCDPGRLGPGGQAWRAPPKEDVLGGSLCHPELSVGCPQALSFLPSTGLQNILQ